MEQLLNYIHSLMPFSAESWQALSPALATVVFKKGQFLLETGKVCDALFFITEGYFAAGIPDPAVLLPGRC